MLGAGRRDRRDCGATPRRSTSPRRGGWRWRRSGIGVAAAGWCGSAAPPTSAGRGCAGGSRARRALANPLDPRAPGAPAWDAELFRARGARARALERSAHDGARIAFHLVAAPGDRALGEGSSGVSA